MKTRTAALPVSLSRDLARAIDPVELALDAGITPDPWQAKALRSTADKELWCCSRQSGKSTTASLLGLHTALYDPGLVIMVSPSQNQSGELLRKTKEHLAMIKDRPELITERQSALALANGAQLLSLPGSESTVRGYSKAKLIIVDEAARVPDALLAAVRPMRATSNGRFIGLTTPFGKRGWFWDAWDHGEGYAKIRITADECPRISKAFLEDERRDLGEFMFRQEYLCEFLEPEDALFDHEIIERTQCGGGTVMVSSRLRSSLDHERQPWRAPVGGEYHQWMVRASETRYVLGLDLGQSFDPSAVCVIEDVLRPDAKPGQRFECLERVKLTHALSVRHLERLPLKLDYPSQAEHVLRMMQRSPIRNNCELAVDATGVGRPVVDLFERAGLRPIAITITAGNSVGGDDDDRSIPKILLVSRLQALLHSNELKISAGLVEAAALVRELKDFRYEFTAAGNPTFGARTGSHDDLVLATAVAAWVATDGRRSVTKNIIGQY